MVKLLITGYMHSGTTMLMSLINAHPQVGCIEFEQGYVEYYDKPREWVLIQASRKVPELKKYVWGDKLPWGLKSHEKKGIRSIKFSRRWLKLFKKQARILHILRHPIDVALSGAGKKPREKNLNDIMSSVLPYIDFLNENKRCATIVYEELVYNPEIYLPKIFEFINVKVTDKIINKVINTQLKFGKINADRAYSYKKFEIETDIDYQKIIEKVKNKL